MTRSLIQQHIARCVSSDDAFMERALLCEQFTRKELATLLPIFDEEAFARFPNFYWRAMVEVKWHRAWNALGVEGGFIFERKELEYAQ